MWNDINTGAYSGMIAETVSIPRENGDKLNVYYSRPITSENVPSIVLIPHMPGWDEWCRETARRFTEHGYAVVCPDIYSKFGYGNPAEISAKVREGGGVSDKSVMNDCQTSINFLRAQQKSNGKVGIIGMCSGGRHAFIAACTLEGLDAAVDCWGGRVAGAPLTMEDGSDKQPIDLTPALSCPLMGIFGNEDKFPSPEEVNLLEERLKENGKDYVFHRYDGAGHGIWYYHNQMYRQQQAMDSIEKVAAFFEKHLK